MTEAAHDHFGHPAVPPRTLDVSCLSDTAFDSQSPVWWGNQSSEIQRVIERLDELHDKVLEGEPSPLEGTVGGVVISDWYAAPDKPDEHMKVTVYILDRRLRAVAHNAGRGGRPQRDHMHLRTACLELLVQVRGPLGKLSIVLWRTAQSDHRHEVIGGRE